MYTDYHKSIEYIFEIMIEIILSLENTQIMNTALNDYNIQLLCKVPA